MKKQKTGMEKQKTGMEKQEAEMEKQGQGQAACQHAHVYLSLFCALFYPDAGYHSAPLCAEPSL